MAFTAEPDYMPNAFDNAPPLVDAVSSLYDHIIEGILSTSDRVTTAAEGKRLLSNDAGNEAMADHVQRVAVLAIPVLRTLVRGARFTRVPWVLLATTAFSVVATVRSGVREVQVIGSLIAHRLEQATGRPADPALVKRLALDLYLAPHRNPRAYDRPLPLRQLLQRWLLKGALGRNTRRQAGKALDAAESLDLQAYIKEPCSP
jgi:hypothetical protein